MRGFQNFLDQLDPFVVHCFYVVVSCSNLSQLYLGIPSCESNACSVFASQDKCVLALPNVNA